jgi:hypothetical protein
VAAIKPTEASQTWQSLIARPAAPPPAAVAAVKAPARGARQADRVAAPAGPRRRGPPLPRRAGARAQRRRRGRAQGLSSSPGRPAKASPNASWGRIYDKGNSAGETGFPGLCSAGTRRPASRASSSTSRCRA